MLASSRREFGVTLVTPLMTNNSAQARAAAGYDLTTRYRGIAKTHLEHVFTAVALNLTRLDAHGSGRVLDRSRTSEIERLAYTLAA